VTDAGVDEVELGLDDEGEDGNRLEGSAPRTVLEYLAKAIVDDPDSVTVEVDESRSTVSLRLNVSPDDMGRVIGRRGRTAQAIRTVVRAAAAREGVRASDVDRAARSVIDEGGYGERFIHRLGHGIGLDGHEHPYLVSGNDEVLERGMAFSIEPGIYLPGRFGVRIEDIAAIGDDGRAEPFNLADHALAHVR